MKAVVSQAIGDIRVENVPEPVIEDQQDAIVRLTASAICGTNLHFVRGTFSGMKKGQILGHEDIGIVESVGSVSSDIRNPSRGDTENPATSAIVTPRPLPVRVSP